MKTIVYIDSRQMEHLVFEEENSSNDLWERWIIPYLGAEKIHTWRKNES